MWKGQWGGKTINEHTKNYFDFDNVKSKVVIASSLFWRLKKASHNITLRGYQREINFRIITKTWLKLFTTLLSKAIIFDGLLNRNKDSLIAVTFSRIIILTIFPVFNVRNTYYKNIVRLLQNCFITLTTSGIVSLYIIEIWIMWKVNWYTKWHTNILLV